MLLPWSYGNDNRTIEERRAEYEKNKQYKKHKLSCQKAHSKRKKKKHIGK